MYINIYYSSLEENPLGIDVKYWGEKNTLCSILKVIFNNLRD